LNHLIEKEEAIVAIGEVPVCTEAVIAMTVLMIMIEGMINAIDIETINAIDIGMIREKREAVVDVVEVAFVETNA